MRNQTNISKLGRRVKGYISVCKNNSKTIEIYKSYIKFIKESGYNKSGMDIVERCEKMLEEAGYLTTPLQDTLEHVFNKAVMSI